MVMGKTKEISLVFTLSLRKPIKLSPRITVWAEDKIDALLKIKVESKYIPFE